MHYRRLGQTGLRVSEIGVGAWQLGGPLTLDGRPDGHPELGRDYCVDLIRRCGELGINFVDTAEQYGDGESERRVGAAVAGRRGDWIISTKFGQRVGPRGARIKDTSPRRIPRSLAGSLRRLGTDYVDVYLYHTAPQAEDLAEAVAVLNDAKRKGQVRAVGISTGNLADVERLHALGAVDVVQFPHSLLDAAQAIPAFLARHGLGGVVRGAFAGGRLSGRYFRAAPQFAADDIRAGRFPAAAAADEFARYAVFAELLTPARGMVQLALRYLLDEPTTHVIITGGKSLAAYRDAARATELPPLTPAEHARIAALRAALSAA